MTAAVVPSDVRRAAQRPAAERIAGPCAAPVAAEGTAAGVALPVLVPGELVAVAGRSGAGKTTLLEAIAERTRAASSGAIGFVPQDDIVHRDLPVGAVLRHAARLRGSRPSREALDARVAEVMDVLGLTAHVGQRVATLSGGQRKRVSIAVELLERPPVLFLDEPTSGLDPATAAALLRTLRELAARGTAVALTTHSTEDLQLSDRLLFVGPSGHVVFDGGVDHALAHFGVTRLAEVYDRCADAAPRTEDGRPPWASSAGRTATPRRSNAPRDLSWLAQFRALVARNVDVMRHNRMSTAIMLGSPALVVAMFVVLFRPGAIERDGLASTTANMTAFWLAFAAFFFGLTFGLLQVVTEMALVRRERFAGVRLGSYLAAKVAVLLPVLLVVVAAMVAVLGAFDRLPGMGARTWAVLVSTLLLDAAAALALGLMASSLVRDASQATLALPMLCFPAVLFSGGVLPVDEMPVAGRALSAATTNRWGFDAVGRTLGVDQVASGAGPARVALVLFASAFLVLAWTAVGMRTRRLGR